MSIAEDINNLATLIEHAEEIYRNNPNVLQSFERYADKYEDQENPVYELCVMCAAWTNHTHRPVRTAVIDVLDYIDEHPNGGVYEMLLSDMGIPAMKVYIKDSMGRSKWILVSQWIIDTLSDILHLKPREIAARLREKPVDDFIYDQQKMEQID